MQRIPIVTKYTLKQLNKQIRNCICWTNIWFSKTLFDLLLSIIISIFSHIDICKYFFQLLTIFVSGKISQYQQYYKNNTDFVKSLGKDHFVYEVFFRFLIDLFSVSVCSHHL